MTELKLSPRDLGPLRLPDFCARCFWITLRCDKKLPFQMGFPGIFMSLDAYGKNLIRAHLEAHGRLPKWFPNVGKVTACVPARELHWSRFQLVDEDTQILLRGTPDDIFQLADGSYHIVDYKTAKVTQTQDSLFPLYEVQLNAYAMICEVRDLTPVAGLSLIYTEPITQVSPDNTKTLHAEESYALRFKATRKPVRIQPKELIKPLLRQAREIYDQPEAPASRANCENCELLENLLSVVT